MAVTQVAKAVPMTLTQPDFLRPFSVGFAFGAVAIAVKLAMEFSGLIA